MADMNLSPGERLRDLRKRRGYDTAEQLAAVVGLAKSTIVGHENGTRGIKPAVAKRYAQVLGVPPEFILYGKNLNQTREIENVVSTRDVALRLVPLLDCRALEQFRSITSGAKPMSEKQIFAPIELPPGNRIFAITQTDNSMLEEGAKLSISKGEHVYINPDKPHKSGHLVLALVPGESSALIRKYRTVSVGPQGKTAFDLVSLNRDHGVVQDAGQLGVEIVGVVIGAYRDFEYEAA